MKAGALVIVAAAALSAKDRIAAIEFFGYKGIDVEAVRRALPLHVGDKRSRNIERKARETVRRITGRDATDVSQICCVGDGDGVIFIGLPGESSRKFEYDPAPSGDAPVSRELADLYRRKMDAWVAAAQSGAAEEDGSPGYSLLKEPRARAAQLALREYALTHEDEIVRTLESDRRGDQRAIAADALGYGARSGRQVAALVRAARDPADDVRNNATRALWEILRAEPAVAAQIPPEPFLAMARSGIWSDRNKGSLVLAPLAQFGGPALAARIKAEAGDALAEMARWREPGWSSSAREILGLP